ncbi:MAG: chromosome segregation protein SMC [Chloroflexota bacterium]
MSRLRELRLHGFKSFADPTRFAFESGINAVIGPNGSGKSNMADAVRWVLGEQSNRSLRTRRADDVIFAGSQHRRPQGMAEAILTLENGDGWLPIDFAEVTIGRRAYRSGESEYLINGARARLRDVTELLGEGRLGANELVVVGQGTVDSALSLRPEERRQLFEEAAGVKNLQVRKNEALARLAKARDNLTRITDLIGELKPQVRRLAVQAQHQEEHESLGRRARAMVVESHRRRERAERDALGEARRRAAAAEAELEAFRIQEGATREAIAAAESRYWAAEEAARDVSRAREASREGSIRAEGRVESLAARRRELGRALADAEHEQAEIRKALDGMADGTADVVEDPAQAVADRARAEWDAAVAELAAADAALLAAEEAVAELRRTDSARIAAAAHRGEELAAGRAREERLMAELTAAESARSALEDSLEAACARGAQLEAELVRSSRALAGSTERSEAAKLRSDEARQLASELAGRVGALHAELEALEERAEHGGRLGARLAAAGWTGLLDAIDAPEATWPAIEALIGGELEQALLWRDGDLLEPMSDARGAARLVAIVDGPVDPVARSAALAAVHGRRTLADWIGNAGPPLFAHTVIAEEVVALLDGWPSLPAGWWAVTPEGDVADGRGLVVLRGRAEAAGGASARQHARRREIAGALERLEAEHETTGARAAREHAAYAEAARDHEAARVAHDSAAGQLRLASSEVDDAEARLARARGESTALAAELEGARGAREAAVQQDDGEPAWGVRLARREEEARTARAAREAAAEARDRARDAWASARERADEADARQSGRVGERNMVEAREAQLSASSASQREALVEAESELVEATAALEAARAADATATEARVRADGERDRLRSELLELERTAGGGARLAELERDAQVAAIEASRHEDALTALGRERQLALDTLPETEAASPGDMPPDEEQAQLRALSDEAIDGELRRVRRTLGQIGSVNPFAIEEHRELAARLDELTRQDADLAKAIGSTEELIAHLDGEIAGKFNAAFAAIGERFEAFCQLLFAGGSASLQLNDGTDDDAPEGIEIVVRPPGKRLQRLAMLSGGERALTGVALLFAMLSVNPVPFCILDEVDAALDEANIGRFALALRKLSETIDFVVITHNRATIEVADTIYGVTMTDAAVSRVLSLRLADLPVEVSA